MLMIMHYGLVVIIADLLRLKNILKCNNMFFIERGSYMRVPRNIFTIVKEYLYEFIRDLAKAKIGEGCQPSKMKALQRDSDRQVHAHALPISCKQA